MDGELAGRIAAEFQRVNNLVTGHPQGDRLEAARNQAQLRELVTIRVLLERLVELGEAGKK